MHETRTGRAERAACGRSIHSRAQGSRLELIMKVSDLMTREVKSCVADDLLTRAAQIMWEGDCGIVPVVDSENRVIGVVTDRDICMAAYTKGLPLDAIRVRDVMAKQVFSCSSQDDVEKALSAMENKQVRRLAVVDEAVNLVGILSLNDLACEAERQHARGGRHLAGARIARTLAAVCQPRRKPEPTVVVPAAAPAGMRVEPLIARLADVES